MRRNNLSSLCFKIRQGKRTDSFWDYYIAGSSWEIEVSIVPPMSNYEFDNVFLVFTRIGK